MKDHCKPRGDMGLRVLCVDTIQAQNFKLLRYWEAINVLLVLLNNCKKEIKCKNCAQTPSTEAVGEIVRGLQ